MKERLEQPVSPHPGIRSDKKQLQIIKKTSSDDHLKTAEQVQGDEGVLDRKQEDGQGARLPLLPPGLPGADISELAFPAANPSCLPRNKKLSDWKER